MSGGPEDRTASNEQRAHAILGGNIARLMKQAYVPALPTPEFRARLTALVCAESQRQARRSEVVLERGAERPRPMGIGRRRLMPAVALMAAAVLILLGLRWNAGSDKLQVLKSAREIVQAGLVAARWDGADTWSAFDQPGAGSELELGQGARLELLTPTDQALVANLRLAAGDAEPHRVRASFFGDTIADLSLQSSIKSDLRIGLELGGIALESQRGILVGGGGRFRFDARGAEFEARHVAHGLLLRSLRATVTLTALDQDDSPLGTAVVLKEGHSANFEDGLFQVHELDLVSGPVDGVRESQGPPVDEGPADTVELPPLQLISVVDAMSGMPIEAVTLALIPKARQNSVLPTRTHRSEAADGWHRFDQIPTGTFKLAVFAEGYSLWTGNFQGFDPEGNFEFEVELTQGGILRGYIVDQISGNPIAGARVLPRADLPASSVPFDLNQPGLWLPILAETGADGSFELPHVSPGEHELHIAAKSFGVHFEAPVLVSEGRVTELAAIALVPEAVLAGSVADQNGVPLEGAQIVVSAFNAGAEGLALYALTQTDVDGHYHLGGLQGGMHFAISVSDAPGGVPDVRPFRARPGETTTVSFGHSAPGTMVTGILRDAQGKAVAMANIALHSSTEQSTDGLDIFRASSTTDSGSFRFESVEPDTYLLMVVSQEGSISVAGLVMVDGRDAELEVELRLGAATAKGRVLRAADNAAIQGVQITLLRYLAGSQQPQFVAEATTAADGTWQATGIHPGGLIAIAYPHENGATLGGPLGFAMSQRVELAEGQSETDLGTIALYPGGRARLVVEDKHGIPVATAHFEVSTADGIEVLASPFPAATPGGVLELTGLAPGPYRVRCSMPDQPPHTSNFSVRAGEETVHRIVLD